MSRLWWTQVTSARRLLEQVITDLGNGKNVIMSFSAVTPWPEDFRELLGEKIEVTFTAKTVVKIAVEEGDVGQYMLDNYCRRELRFNYRPPQSEGAYLGECKSLTINDNVFWIKVYSPEMLHRWVKFIGDYRRARNNDSSYALFIIDATGLYDDVQQNKFFSLQHIGMEIPEYVRYTFASILADEAGVKASTIEYLTQLIVSCCDDIELIPLCIEKQAGLLADPNKPLSDIVMDNIRSDGTAFKLERTGNALEQKVWEAQVKVLFPIVERYRLYIVQKLRKRIEESLSFPYKTNFGELAAPEELELKDLVFAIGKKRMSMDDSVEYERLTNFHRCRNLLAHGKTLDYRDIKYILGNGAARSADY